MDEEDMAFFFLPYVTHFWTSMDVEERPADFEPADGSYKLLESCLQPTIRDPWECPVVKKTINKLENDCYMRI